MKHLANLDLNGNQLLNALAQSIAGDPGAPANGQFWYDSSATVWKWRANGVTVNPLARASHTGTQLASTISDFDTQVRTSRLDQMANPTANVSMNSNKITNLTDGSSAADAATYGQLQAVQMGRQFKDAVRAATTANITLSGAQTIDGVSIIAGDRVLVKNQSTGSQNGIYLCAAGAWTRTTDADNVSPDSEMKTGMTVMVSEGTTQADQQWTLTTNGAITIGTTTLVFAQSGAGTTYTAGNGISISGGAISVDTAVTVRKYATDIGNGSSTSIAVTHSLGTKDVTVSVRQNSDDAHVQCDIVSTSTSQITLTFSVAPASNALRVVVHA